MPSEQAVSIAESIDWLIESKFNGLERQEKLARIEIADGIDKLLKNLLVARIDQYTV